MSNESLPIFKSKHELSSPVYDYFNTLFLPATCAFGLLTSVFNLLGSFRTDTSNSQSLNYIFINSLVDLCFLLTQFFVFVFRCGALCSFSYDYLSQLYHIQIFWLVGYTLVNSQVLFGTYVSIGRLRLFTARTEMSKTPRLSIVYLVCVLIAIGPNLFTNSLPFQVVPIGIYQPLDNATDGQILYEVDFTAFFQTPTMEKMLTVVYSIKDPIMYVMYCGVNILVAVRFRKFLSKKQNLVSIVQRFRKS